MIDANDFVKAASGRARSERMPLVFVGHGNPMNALYDNRFTQALAGFGKELGAMKPDAILVVSAHWLSDGTFVNVTPSPETIYDFYGFPEELYRVRYTAPGAPIEAHATAAMLARYHAAEDPSRGLDHGAWTILRHMFPAASIPTYQLSIDYHRPPEYHFALGRALQSLRERGVLIIGSGNIVHNLRMVDFADDAVPLDWAVEFDEIVKGKLLGADYPSLVEYQRLGRSSALAIPTNDHYLPMLYSLGAAHAGEELRFVHEEIQNGSVSMRTFRIG